MNENTGNINYIANNCSKLPLSFPDNRTFALIKPDAVKAKRVGQILERIEAAGFQIVDKKLIHIDRDGQRHCMPSTTTVRSLNL